MRFKDIINKVSEELDLPKDLVENTYKAYWNFIKDTIEELPLKTELTQKEYNKLKTNINILCFNLYDICSSSFLN